jgi:hypothetical protein
MNRALLSRDADLRRGAGGALGVRPKKQTLGESLSLSCWAMESQQLKRFPETPQIDR